MAHTKSAQKRIRQTEKRRQHNASQRSMMRTYIKKVRKTVQVEGFDAALEAYKQVQGILDRLATHGLIHKNKAARHKSALIQQIKKLEGSPASS